MRLPPPKTPDRVVADWLSDYQKDRPPYAVSEEARRRALLLPNQPYGRPFLGMKREHRERAIEQAAHALEVLSLAIWRGDAPDGS